MCEHLHFEADVEVARVEPSGLIAEMAFVAQIQVRCAECKTRFAFKGVPCGFSWQYPMVDPVGFELRAPIQPDAHGTSMLGGDPETAFPHRRAASPGSTAPSTQREEK